MLKMGVMPDQWRVSLYMVIIKNVVKQSEEGDLIYVTVLISFMCILYIHVLSI